MLRQSFHVIRRNSWKPLQQQSCFSIGSQNSDYSLYQYPMAKEPPKITTTTAAEALAKSSSATISPKSSSRNDAYDPFDDTNSLSDFERESIRSMQKKHLRLIPPGASPIGQKAPSHIPPNAPSESLEVPETKVTTLDNGIRVVSQETYSQMCVVGVLANFGSRQEHQLGTAHLSELLAFQSTVRYPDTVLLQDNMRKWGASSFAHSGREQTLWCLDLLRPNVSLGMELLQQATLQPQFLQSEVEMCKQAMTFQMMDALPEVILGEALQTAAFGIDQSLGKNHLAPLEAIEPLSSSSVQDYFESNFWNDPQNVVIAGTGIGHEEFVDMAFHNFGHMQQGSTQSSNISHSLESPYRGGECRTPLETIDGMTSVGIAVEIGGWSSDDLVPACVLQTLLGGGSSFSAGGPGKGMYSRLYRQVLNRYYWADMAESFTSFHTDSGLFGIVGRSKPAHSRDAVRVFSEHLLRLAHDPVTDEELDRARNMLKNNVLTQLESRLVLFEDIGRQILTYGKRESNAETTKKIDSVTKEDVRNLMIRALQKPPSVAAVGPNVNGIPSYTEVKSWFTA